MRGPNGAKNADTHFARACAVDTHVSILQAMAEEPLQKYRDPDGAQNADTYFAQACAIEMHLNISYEASE